MADIGLQACYGIPNFSTPSYSDTKVPRGVLVGMTQDVSDHNQNINYRGTPVARGTIQGSTQPVVNHKFDINYIGTPVNRGLLPTTINGVPPSSVDLKKLNQIWN